MSTVGGDGILRFDGTRIVLLNEDIAKESLLIWMHPTQWKDHEGIVFGNVLY